MITVTEFIEKVDAIMGQKNMDDKKANQLCHLYAMICRNGFNAGYNACVEATSVWLKAMLWKNPKTDKIECGCMNTSMNNFIEDYKRRLKVLDMTRQEELVQAARKEYPEWEEAQCHFIDGAHYADSHPHWISVEDELPPKDDEFITDMSIDVLVTDGETIYRCFYDYDIMCWLDGNFLQFDNITHWMPLPSLPVLSNSSNIGKDLKGGKG